MLANCLELPVLRLFSQDFSSNPNLAMVPKAWQGDTESVLFVCKIHREYMMQMQEIKGLNTDLEKHSQYLELDQLAMKVRQHDATIVCMCYVLK